MSNHFNDHKSTIGNVEEFKAGFTMPANQEAVTHTLISARESLVMLPVVRPKVPAA